MAIRQDHTADQPERDFVGPYVEIYITDGVVRWLQRTAEDFFPLSLEPGPPTERAISVRLGCPAKPAPVQKRTLLRRYFVKAPL